MQMGLGNTGDQLGAFERQAICMFRFDDHQNAANGLHERSLQQRKGTALHNYSCYPNVCDLMHINSRRWWSAGRPV